MDHTGTRFKLLLKLSATPKGKGKEVTSNRGWEGDQDEQGHIQECRTNKRAMKNNVLRCATQLIKVIRLAVMDGGMNQNTELENLKVTPATIETNTQKHGF